MVRCGSFVQLAALIVVVATLAAHSVSAHAESQMADSNAIGQWKLEKPQLPIESFVISLYDTGQFEAWRSIRGTAPEIFAGTFTTTGSSDVELVFTQLGNDPIPPQPQKARLNKDGTLSLLVAPGVDVRFLRVPEE